MAIKITCERCSDQQTLCCDGSSGMFNFTGLVFENEVGAKTFISSPFEYTISGSVFKFRDLKNTTYEVDWNNTEFASAADLNTFINNCKCDSGCTRDLIEITDDDLASAGNPTTADVKTFVDNNLYTNAVIYYVGAGSNPSPAGTKVSPDYTWEVDCEGNVVRTEYPQGGGGGAGGCAFRYKVATENCVVKATNTGVTASLATGIFTITIPAGVKLCSFYIWGVAADLDGDNTLTVRIDDSANGGMNTSEDLMLPWTVQKWNEASRAVAGLDTAPFNLNLQDDPLIQLSAVSGSILDHKVINLNGLPYWGLKFVE